MNIENTIEQKPLTAGQIGRKLGRSTFGVKKAITRLGIEPILELNGVSFYPQSTIGVLQRNMKAKARTKSAR